MNDLFRDFLVWLMSFSGCSLLVFAAACFAKNLFKSRQKQATAKQPAKTDASSPAGNAQLSPKIKWLVFALAPIMYLILLGPALSELHSHFQKIQAQRVVLSQTAEIPQTIQPIPDSVGARGLSQISDRISKNQIYRTGNCSCRKRNAQETSTQSAIPDDAAKSDESVWEVSPGWQLSTVDIYDVAEVDVADVEQDAQID